jgi:hypothetical protein
MMPFPIAIAAVSPSAVVTVSGEIIQSDDPTPEAGVRFNIGGTIDKNQGTSYSQIDAVTDWIIPNAAASKKTYHLRATLNAESGGGNKTGTLNTWLELVTTREWKIERLSGQGAGTSIWDLDIEISDDGGSTTIDTGLFELDSLIL